MFQPEELKTPNRLKWSPGRGTDVWELFCAGCSGDVVTLQRLLAKDPSLVRCHYGYRTPLYFAVRENRIEAVRYLLDRGANPLALEVNDNLLEICRDRGYVELERLLADTMSAQFGASVDGEQLAELIRQHYGYELRRQLDSSPELLHQGDLRSNQPIHWAVMTRQIDVIDELLDRGANIEATRSDGARPIQLVNGDYYFRGWRDVAPDWPITPMDVLNHLRAHGADCDICTACYLGDFDQVRLLLARDPASANRVSSYVSYYLGSGSPLRNAAAKGHLEIVRLLLERGADPNLPEEGIAPDGHALYAAVENGHHAIAQLLLEHGATPNPEVESSADALSRAIMNDDLVMIELLCSYGASRAVHLLAYYGDVRTAAAVFAANPALADDPEALVNAAGEGHEPFVRLMLRYQPRLPERQMFPAWSVGGKTHALNELLFKHGMNPSKPDWLNITPLHHFARKGDVENAKLFLDYGADLNAVDDDLCSTPLGWAAKFGQLEMVKLLVSRGADPYVPIEHAWAQPIAWAMRRQHIQIVDYLLARLPAPGT